MIWLVLSQPLIVQSQPNYPYPYLPSVPHAQPQQLQPQPPQFQQQQFQFQQQQYQQQSQLQQPQLQIQHQPYASYAQFDPATTIENNNINNGNINNGNNINGNNNGGARRSLIFPLLRRGKNKPTKLSWQQITARHSFVGRNLRGMEIFGGQIEPSTISSGNFFTTLETFTYNRNALLNSEIENNTLKFNVTSLVGAQPIPLNSLPTPGAVNTNQVYDLKIEKPYPDIMRDEVVAFLGKVANGTAAMTDFDVTASGDLIDYAKNYGVEAERVVFDQTHSTVSFQNPIGDTYKHENNLKDAQITYNFLAKYTVPYHVGGGGAYGLGRQKAADNMSITPTNRIIFDYNYFHNIQFTQGVSKIPIQINRFTIGFEKTLLNEIASIEFRIPLAVTVNNQLTLFGENNVDEFRLGDFTAVTKYVIYERRNVLWTTGFGVSLPIAEDLSIVERGTGKDIIRWKNRTVHFMPYLGFSVVPDDRLFFNAILQGDGALIGDSTYIADFTQPDSKRMISIGKTYDRSYLYASLSIGYWLRRQEIWNDQPPQYYTYNGQAPMTIAQRLNPMIPRPQTNSFSNWAMNFTAELHWTQSIKKLRGVYYKQGNYLFDIGNDSSSFHAVDMTLGTRLLFNKKTSLGVGYTVPLTGKNRQFDGELRATFNKYF
jgi:hypothetical protein